MEIDVVGYRIRVALPTAMTTPRPKATDHNVKIKVRKKWIK